MSIEKKMPKVVPAAKASTALNKAARDQVTALQVSTSDLFSTNTTMKILNPNKTKIAVQKSARDVSGSYP